jgi:hypothetical protein
LQKADHIDFNQVNTHVEIDSHATSTHVHVCVDLIIISGGQPFAKGAKVRGQKCYYESYEAKITNL